MPSPAEESAIKTSARNGWLLSTPALVLLSIAAVGPLLIVVVYSFLTPGEHGNVVWEFSTGGWVGILWSKDIFTDEWVLADAHLTIFWRSVSLSLLTTVFCFVVGFPTAWFIATRPARERALWLFLITIPFWTNLLIRTYAINEVLRKEGLMNTVLMGLGLTNAAIDVLYTQTAIFIGMTYVYLPLMVLPLFAAIDRFDIKLLEAAYDLYASRMQVLRRVILPIVKPGIIAGSILVFVPSLGAYVTPRVLGGGKQMMIGNFIELRGLCKDMGAEIIRLWCASTDYSGDLAMDKTILARVVDGYRRIRNTLRFLLANTSDFDAATDAVPLAEMLEIDRWALARAAQFQHEVLAHYEVYEFHPVVAKLQVYCSEDLGAFYLDILKDRLYTTAASSHARRSAQTALWRITHAMLRWMAPFLSFTAEEAWKVFAPGQSPTIYTETYSDVSGWLDAPLLERWKRIREIREVANKDIEAVRTAGLLGSSLQACLLIGAGTDDLALLASLGADLKFVTITSKATLTSAETLTVTVTPASAAKCERCWHYRDDVGHDPAHPTICGRCTSNLYGDGERRTVA